MHKVIEPIYSEKGKEKNNMKIEEKLAKDVSLIRNFGVSIIYYLFGPAQDKGLGLHLEGPEWREGKIVGFDIQGPARLCGISV